MLFPNGMKIKELKVDFQKEDPTSPVKVTLQVRACLHPLVVTTTATTLIITTPTTGLFSLFVYSPFDYFYGTCALHTWMEGNLAVLVCTFIGGYI